MDDAIDIAKLKAANRGVFHDAPFDICSYCFKKLTKDQITKDHIHPRSQGGRGNNNLATACYDCNQDKADLSLLTYLSLQHQPKRRKKKLKKKRRQQQARKDTNRNQQERLESGQMAILRLFKSGARNLVVSQATREEFARM